MYIADNVTVVNKNIFVRFYITNIINIQYTYMLNMYQYILNILL